jgi:AcrR family transcriptional regulator
MEDRKRRSIVETAIALAEKDGFEAVRLRDIAALAKVALGTVYRRFRSKEDILLAALAHLHGQLTQQLLEDPIHGATPKERVQMFFDVFTNYLLSKPKLARALLRAVSSATPGLRTNVMAYHGSMIQLITDAMRGPGYPEDGPPVVDNEYDIAFHLWNIWYALLIGWSGGLYDDSQVKEHMNRASDMLFASA